MMARWRLRVAGAALAVLLPLLAVGAGAPLDGAGIDEHVGAQLPLELPFTSASGARVRLGDVFRDGKPVVLVLAYYHCSMLCPLVLRGTSALASRTTPRPGTDYHLLAVSIDPRDRPADAARARDDLLAMSADPVRDWQFWTGSTASVTELARALGFRYRYDAKSDQFAHAAVVFVLTADGRVSRYLYGVDPPRAQLEAALQAAAKGDTGSSFERVIQRCFHYLPALRRYGDSITTGLRGGGVLVLASVVGGLALLARSVRRRAAP